MPHLAREGLVVDATHPILLVLISWFTMIQQINADSGAFFTVEGPDGKLSKVTHYI